VRPEHFIRSWAEAQGRKRFLHVDRYVNVGDLNVPVVAGWTAHVSAGHAHIVSGRSDIFVVDLQRTDMKVAGSSKQRVEIAKLALAKKLKVAQSHIQSSVLADGFPHIFVARKVSRWHVNEGFVLACGRVFFLFERWNEKTPMEDQLVLEESFMADTTHCIGKKAQSRGARVR
jgi:hypothetical protein